MTQTSNPWILWGTPHSLYTGKARSCLIKKGIPFEERCPSHPDFKAQVRPAVGMVTFPVLQTPDGRYIQDSTDIVSFLETAGAPGTSMLPPTPLQRAVATLTDGFGLEGLLHTAMHYRWSYRHEQELFLQTEFGRGLYAGADREERRAAGRRIMDLFSSSLPGLGVSPATAPAIEAACEELLEALDAHFQCWPYLLGWRVSIADLGLIAPLYAHLGRDPYPSALMKKRAPNVARWVERMQLPNTPDGEYAPHRADWLADDAIPPTLEPVLALLFKDWGPQLMADVECLQQWLNTHPNLAPGSMVHVSDKPAVHATVGMVGYTWRGVRVQRASAVHGLWLFQRALQAVHALGAGAQQGLHPLFQRTGGQEMLALQMPCVLERRNNVIVVGQAAA